MLDPDLVTWLGADHDAVAGWEPDPALETLRCHPDLVARLAEVSRPIPRIARVFVAGCPVIHHPRGVPIAAAAGTSWLVARSDKPPGALTPRESVANLGPDWVELDPWSVDVAFAKGTDLLRAHVTRAYELAEVR
jgi:hypothetical protein